MKQITDANGFVEVLRNGGKVYYMEGGSYVEATALINPFTKPSETFYRLQTEDEFIENALRDLAKEEETRYAYTGQRIKDEDYFRYGWEAHKEYISNGNG